MAKKPSFEEQFPGYELVPDKKKVQRRLEWASLWAFAIFVMIAVPGLLLFKLSLVQPPTANTTYAVKSSIARLANTATLQSKEGNHTEAARSFKTYFELGGHDANMMALYAFSLSEIGNRAEAVEWSRKAIKTAPDSKAARMIHDALEPKK